MIQRLLTGLLMLAIVVCAQRRVDPRNTYHRVICVVPLVGAGTPDDPRRPKYAPAKPAAKPTETDIIAFTQVPTDDGKFAIVEFVAKSRKAFEAILADPSVTSFEKGVHTREEIETEMRKHTRSFNLDKFGVVMP